MNQENISNIELSPIQSNNSSINGKRDINPSKSIKPFSIISNNHNNSFTNYNSKRPSYNTKPPHLTYGINYKRQNSVRGPNTNRIVYVRSSKKYPLENILQKHQRDINGIIITSNLKSVNTERCNTIHNNHKKLITDIKMVVSSSNSISSSENEDKDNNELNQQTTQDKDSTSLLTSKRVYQQQLLRNSLILPQNIILDQVISNTEKIYIKDIKGELFYNKKVIINAAGLIKKPSKNKTKQSRVKKQKNNFIISSERRDGVTYFSNNKNDNNIDYLLNYTLYNPPEGNTNTENKIPLLKFKVELSQKNLKYYFKPLSSKTDKQITPFNEIEKIEYNDSGTFYLKITKRIVILKRKVQTLLGIDTFIFISDIQGEIISITKFNLNKEKEWQKFYNRVEIIGKEETSQRQNNDDSSEYDDINEEHNIKKGKTNNTIRDNNEEKRIYFDKDGLNKEWFLGYNKIFHTWFLDVDGNDYSNLDNAWEACDNEVEIKNELVVKIGENVFKIYKQFII